MYTSGVGLTERSRDDLEHGLMSLWAFFAFVILMRIEAGLPFAERNLAARRLRWQARKLTNKNRFRFHLSSPPGPRIAGVTTTMFSRTMAATHMPSADELSSAVAAILNEEVRTASLMFGSSQRRR
jgi:hypothetical protein